MDQEFDHLTVFKDEVLAGLRATEKHLSSKYFYDAVGDDLFQQIMGLEEYYLTAKELEIFETKSEEILQSLGREPFRLIELGAGDGTKTRILIRYFLDQGVEFEYCPIDISGSVLKSLETTLRSEFSALNMNPVQGDYFNALSELASRPGKDVVFFLGSNIGNFGNGMDVKFLKELNDRMKVGDLLFMGADLKKDPSIILSAYNDAKGVTKEFNLNLLRRINRELKGDFDTSAFQHYPYYNPQTGECRSYLISKKDQKVRICGESVFFRSWEAIFMEISKKYDLPELEEKASECGFKAISTIMDADEWYADVIWEKV